MFSNVNYYYYYYYRYIPEGFKKIEKCKIMGMIISPCNQGPANYHVTRWR